MIRKKVAEPKRTSKLETPPDKPIVSPPPPALTGEAEVGETDELPEQPSSSPFPIVGIGASAGGLGAFEAFFAGMPAEVDPGMAFVLVQHLAPDHKSILADLIRRYTRMSVFEVVDGMVVRPNCAYIIPPGRDMAFLNGTLQLLEPLKPRGQRLPIDFFFRSLAQDQHHRAIGVVLSGTGSDGTAGVRAIKGEGGMVMAQTPESTEFDGMPRSALATGLVDFELPPAEMARQLMAYTAHAFGKSLSRPPAIPMPKQENAVKKIFVLLRSQTGHDFSQYKPSTIHRRIERRMAVHQIDSLEGYVKFMQRTPAEVEALFRDLLIGVTNFFRDTEAFQVLEEQVIPKLFVEKPAGSVIRVWCPGCSTGEEAYSIAILLQERMEALKQSNTLQVFATDIDSRAVATARAGLYSASIAVDLSRERLARYFVAEPDGSTYRIHKNIRDLIVFSEQNVIKDPPFSKLDLISCRNLLIYMGQDLQKKLIPLFHYALNPGGMLFLGTSETVGDFNDLFTVIDRKAKLYQRKEDFRGGQRAALGHFLPPMTAILAALPGVHPQAAARMAVPVKLPLRELTEQTLLQKVTPTGALVNGKGDILYMHGRTGMYLELGAGEGAFPNILKMAREGLRHELATALHKAKEAKEAKEAINYPGLRVKTNGHFTRVNLSIHQVATGLIATVEAPLYLVVLEEGPPLEEVSPDPSSENTDPSLDIDGRLTALKEELRAKEEYLQTANEELETSNEELKSSNEEMQSVNEELQSTNEELETSKEELQSVCEELATVNGELQTKVVDLSRANNDMNNLLAGTGIGTVFVDMHLRILRFTPTVSAIINLILSDVGRPVGHIVSNLVGYDRLVADVQAVLDTLIPKEVEVQTTKGEWYTMRTQPYRTLENMIEGAVITFVDITEMKKIQEALRERERMLQDSQAVAHIGAYMTNLTAAEFDTNTWQASSEIYKIFGIDTAYPHTLAGWVGFIHPDSREELFAYHKRVVEERKRFDHQYKIIRINDGAERWVQGTGELEYDEHSNPVRMLGTIQDITERKLVEESLLKANEQCRLAVVVRDSHDAITVQDLEGRTLAWNPGAVRLYGWSEAEALEINVCDRIPEGLRAGSLDTLAQLSRAEILEPYHTQRLTQAGALVEVSIISTALIDGVGQMYAIATTERLKESRLG